MPAWITLPRQHASRRQMEEAPVEDRRRDEKHGHRRQTYRENHQKLYSDPDL